MNYIYAGIVILAVVAILLIAVVAMSSYIITKLNAADTVPGCKGNADLSSAHTWLAWVIGLSVTGVVLCALAMVGLFAYQKRATLAIHAAAAKKSYEAYRGYK